MLNRNQRRLPYPYTIPPEGFVYFETDNTISVHCSLIYDEDPLPVIHPHPINISNNNRGVRNISTYYCKSANNFLTYIIVNSKIKIGERTLQSLTTDIDYQGFYFRKDYVARILLRAFFYSQEAYHYICQKWREGKDHWFNKWTHDPEVYPDSLIVGRILTVFPGDHDGAFRLRYCHDINQPLRKGYPTLAFNLFKQLQAELQAELRRNEMN